MKITCDIEGGPDVTLHGTDAVELKEYLEGLTAVKLDDPELSIDIGFRHNRIRPKNASVHDNETTKPGN